MVLFSLAAALAALRLFTVTSAVPLDVSVGLGLTVGSTEAASTSSWWFANVQRTGTVPFGGPSGYTIFRNVMDFGAKGDGSTDDTAAINNAISSGGRCGLGCDSTTTTPAIVYFPPGTYVVSSPLIQYYFTQFVGDAISPPTLKASASFAGIAVIDADPYTNTGANWYTNQNNFYRQIRNFIIDTTAMPVTAGTGIHWQVAQATSLQNIVFNMRSDGGTSNAQQGIFMDNGSGGFMTDLVFNGGKYGAFFGNQQFTTRNLTFNNCQTAIFMNWNWLWTLQGITINSATNVGIDIANGGDIQTVGSVLLLDSSINNTPVGISTSFTTSESGTNGTLILDNVDMSTNVPVAVKQVQTGATILAGNTHVSSWMQGSGYSAANSRQVVQGSMTAATKPSCLTSGGKIFTRSKPQYQDLPASSFISVKAHGAVGNGIADDTAAIQAIFNSASPSDVVYFDHGAYLITSTVTVPAGVRMTGEIWPMIMAGGSSAFKDQTNPTAVFKVGTQGESGNVEMSDLVFQTVGAQPGAVLIEWNLVETAQGASGMWDVHTRIGGSAGTDLQSNTCTKNPTVTAPANAACEGAFLLLHVNKGATIYLENNWFWVADHELDLSDHNQINIFNGRGVFVDSTPGPVWMWGTASEHNVLYNYQVSDSSNIFMAAIQTETPYFQSNPNAETPFTVNTAFNDPNFSSTCSNTDTCPKSWGLRVLDSSDVLVYGAGLYSFYDNYDQTCLTTESCQDNMVDIQSSTIQLYGLSTKAATNMVTLNSASAALDSANRNNFCATIGLFSVQQA